MPSTIDAKLECAFFENAIVFVVTKKGGPGPGPLGPPPPVVNYNVLQNIYPMHKGVNES